MSCCRRHFCRTCACIACSATASPVAGHCDPRLTFPATNDYFCNVRLPHRRQQDQQPVFEEEFILSTSTQNRLKEHELMNAIITRSAAEFVDVNQASDMLDDDDDPFEVSREFSAQVADATVRPRDRMAPQCLPAPSNLLSQPRAVIDVLAVRSVTTQERAEIDNIAFQLADAVSQVCMCLWLQ